MNRRSLVGLSATLGLGLVALPDPALSQRGSLKELLVGAWSLLAANATLNGTKIDLWGPNPKGSAIFVANGRYSFMLSRSDLPRFAADNRAKGTPEENAAVVHGFIADSGTWSMDESSKTLTTNIEVGSFPNLVGGSQKRLITSLTADELKYTILAGTTGAVVETVWKRTM